MKRLQVALSLGLLALLVLVGHRVRTTGAAVEGAVRASPAELLVDPESAYRLRLAELSLASGHAPRVDSFLAGVGRPPVPWPPAFSAGLAALARATVARAGGDGSLRGVDEPDLERVALLLGPILGALAAALAFLFVFEALADGKRSSSLRAGGGLLAAALYAFWPEIVEAQALGRVTPDGGLALLSFAQLYAVTRALRGGEMSDVSAAAMFAGLFAGLALASSAQAVALVAATVFVWALRILRGAAAERGDALRVALLYAAALVTVLVLPRAGTGPLSWLAPGEPSMVAGRAAAWIAWGAFPAAWLVLLFAGSGAPRQLLLVFGPLVLAAGLVDGRFEPVFLVAAVATFAQATVLVLERVPRRARVPALAGCGLVLSPAFAGAPSSPPTVAELERRAAWVGGLRWMRRHTPSPAPFNNGAARPDWSVLTDPRQAGAVIYHARRPVVAAHFRGVPGQGRLERAREALRETDLERFLEDLLHLGARYVVVSPQMVTSLAAPADGVLARLALPEPGAATDHVPGLELVYASSIWSPAAPGGLEGPALTIYRTSTELARPGSRLEAADR